MLPTLGSSRPLAMTVWGIWYAITHPIPGCRHLTANLLYQVSRGRVVQAPGIQNAQFGIRDGKFV